MASGSAWRSLVGSWRRWAARSSSRTPPAAARRWCFRCGGPNERPAARPSERCSKMSSYGRFWSNVPASRVPGLVISRVLVVDDEPQIRKTLEVNLRARRYDVDLASTGERALELAARHHPDVVVLDLGLPGIGGVEVIEGLRGWSAVPIIVLSVREAESDKVAALDAGADDYVTKPFGMDELLARLRAAVRRAAPTREEEAVVETDDSVIDL